MIIDLMNINIPDFWIMIVTATLCGTAVGMERQIRGKPAGVRTSILICLGTAVFISTGLAFANSPYVDKTRILGQVITGIGFLGAGVILTRGKDVMGITSASVIWMLAAIGSMIGFKLYLESLIISGVTVIVLVIIGIVEGKYKIFGKGIYSVDENHKIYSITSSDYSRLEDFIIFAKQGRDIGLEVELLKHNATKNLQCEKNDAFEKLEDIYFLTVRYSFDLEGKIYTISKIYSYGNLNDSSHIYITSLKNANERLRVDYERLKSAKIAFKETYFT